LRPLPGRWPGAAADRPGRRAAPPRGGYVASPASGYYPNCAAAEAAGAAPLYRGGPGYRSALDADHDGVACEVWIEEVFARPTRRLQARRP
jgi:hypothetical protein